MNKKIKLEKFSNLQQCEDFLNDFCSRKRVLSKRFMPFLSDSGVVFFVFFEYIDTRNL